MPKKFLSCVVIAAAIVAAASESRSQPRTPQPDISTDLVVGEVSTNDDPFGGWIGLRVHLGAGWKIYWKSPGGAGLPPEFDWSASSNLAAAEVHWPAPHRTSFLGVESLGYTGDVLFPVKVQLTDPDYDTHVELKLVLYACSTICIRQERVLAADLSRAPSPDAQALIDEWRSKVPATGSASVRGDWTRPDPRIADYLKSFGRYGLPFDIVFGPAAPEGIVLPELLTTDAVLSAFARSSGSPQSSIEPK